MKRYVYIDRAGNISQLDPATTPPTEAARLGLRRVPYTPSTTDAEHNSILDAALDSKERQTLLPRAARELLLLIAKNAGLSDEQAYKKLKKTDEELVALRGKRK